MSFDLLIQDGEVATPEGVIEANILVQDGKIAALLEPGAAVEALSVDQVLDASGQVVLPGMVDLHVHIGEPGKEEKEDVVTGTSAAAAGGVTTIVVMPNCVPPVNSRERLLQRAELFEAKSFVDFALLGGAGGESVDTIVEQAEAGAVGYKSYVGSYREERKGLICADTADIYAVLEKIAETGCFIGFHAEDKPTISLLQERLVEEGRVGYDAWLKSRPEFTEILATLPLLEIARVTGARLYLVHMSSPDAIDLAALWREQGTDVTIETCPHYLLFSDEDTRRMGPHALVAPPLRRPASRSLLWELVQEGVVDVIATDHAPGTPEQKEQGQDNIFEGGGGLPEFEVVWPLLLSEVNTGRLTLPELVWLVAEHPARIAQLYPTKGAIIPGADADFVLADLTRTHTLSKDTMYTKNPDSATLFDGMGVQGYVSTVVQRGSIIARDGTLTNDEPIGAHWIKP